MLTITCPSCGIPTNDEWDVLNEDEIHSIKCQYCRTQFYALIFDCENCCAENAIFTLRKEDLAQCACRECGFHREQKETDSMKQLICEKTGQVGSEKITLKLYRVSDGFILERGLEQEDGQVPTQVLPFASLSDLEKFVKSDPHYSALQSQYAAIIKISGASS